MTLNELIGMPIVSMSDGEKVGIVNDVLIETETFKITAILLGGKPGIGLLPFSDVRNIGSDAITIESALSLQWATGNLSAVTGRKASELKGLSVVDSSGTTLGSLHDIRFDVVAGQVISLHISRGGVFGVGAQHTDVFNASVRSIGASMITVEAAPPASS